MSPSVHLAGCTGRRGSTKGGKVQRWKLAAGLALGAALLVPTAAQAKTTLVAVESTDHVVINRLEALGLDVTYEGSNRTEVMLHGPEDAEILNDTGYRTTVLDDDIDGENDEWLAREDAA